MLNENIKNIRSQKGMTQNELAIRLHVVRQTVSKWEKGLSVPDAEMLEKIAEVLETDVATLLGVTVSNDQEQSDVANQLARVNEQLIIHNRRSKHIWTFITIILLILLFWFVGDKFVHSRTYLRMISQPKPIDLSYTCEVVDDGYCLAPFTSQIVSQKGRLFIINYYEDDVVITFKEENGEVAFTRTIPGDTIDSFRVKLDKTYILEVQTKGADPKEKVRVLVFVDDVPNDVYGLYY